MARIKRDVVALVTWLVTVAAHWRQIPEQELFASEQERLDWECFDSKQW